MLYSAFLISCAIRRDQFDWGALVGRMLRCGSLDTTGICRRLLRHQKSAHPRAVFNRG